MSAPVGFERHGPVGVLRHRQPAAERAVERHRRRLGRSAVVACFEAAATLPFSEGAAVEARLFNACRVAPQSKAMRYLFFAEPRAAKIPGLPPDVALRPVRSVGIVGAETMGGGIAMNFAMPTCWRRPAAARSTWPTRSAWRRLSSGLRTTRGSVAMRTATAPRARC